MGRSSVSPLTASLIAVCKYCSDTLVLPFYFFCLSTKIKEILSFLSVNERAGRGSVCPVEQGMLDSPKAGDITVSEEELMCTVGLSFLACRATATQLHQWNYLACVLCRLYVGRRCICATISKTGTWNTLGSSLHVCSFPLCYCTYKVQNVRF